eukprot:TRINITY_DN41742_c0_g1_i1.p1 TRINITY_DN41742_c0_g1~~TRINITY_DN41742_c0_g1_i1.p1  ORF type:complete len:942 (+),score=299.47 TRINITY_DN41742_c0_g1_i1:239-2827(+)
MAEDMQSLREQIQQLQKDAGVAEEMQVLREQVEQLQKEKEEWLEEKARLKEELEESSRENEVLQSRCQKLARVAAAAQEQAPKVDAEVQTAEAADADAEGEKANRLPPVVEQMLQYPKDSAIQMQSIEALFAEQTQVDGGLQGGSMPALRGSLEGAVAIFSNHGGNTALVLKASQFLSVLLAEPNVEEHLPLSTLFQAAKDVVAVSSQLLTDSAALSQDAAAGKVGGAPSPSKLLTWLLSLLALLLPCTGTRLKDPAQGEAFVRRLLEELVSPLLSSAALQQEALILKCVQLLPLLPMEGWIQKACLESGAVHALALAFHRTAASAGSVPRDALFEMPLPKAVRSAVRCVFAQNLELCVRALDDTFVNDEFVCLEVLEELRGSEKKHRGTYAALDAQYGLIGKALGLWAFHQRRALEDPDPATSSSREVLVKVADLLCSVVSKLTPQRVLARMQEFEDAEVLQRIALAIIHTSGQLRLQLAVNYLDNNVVAVVIWCLQMLLRRYESAAEAGISFEQPTDLEAAVRLVADDKLPVEGWPYIVYCLDICIHVLSHWAATKASLQAKAEVADQRAAPLLLAKSGLVDVLVELMDPAAAGFEFGQKIPQPVASKAAETLQALFDQNGCICLFCMQHYKEVRQIISLGCDSLATDPLAAFPEMQVQAVEQLAASFDKFSAEDERLGRKILKALSTLFESSYRLVAWFLQNHPFGAMQELQCLDVHAEAVRAVARAPYWSNDDVQLLPEFVDLVAQLLLGCIEGLLPSDVPVPGRRVLDLTEAEQVAQVCSSCFLHLLMIDPSPPTVQQCLAQSLAQYGRKAAGDDNSEQKEDSDEATRAIMRVMEVFPSSDQVQLHCQHLLTSILRE